MQRDILAPLASILDDCNGKAVVVMDNLMHLPSLAPIGFLRSMLMESSARFTFEDRVYATHQAVFIFIEGITTDYLQNVLSLGKPVQNHRVLAPQKSDTAKLQQRTLAYLADRWLEAGIGNVKVFHHCVP